MKNMIIGIPREIKNSECRVALVPSGAKTLTDFGHTVLVEKCAGLGSGFSDDEYIKAGAKIMDSAEELWKKSDMIVKVKEPQQSEFKYLREDLILFTYLHLAAEAELTKMLMQTKVNAIAYETIQTANGELPLLTPMSEIAGKMSVQIGARLLEKHNSGKGLLLGGIPGVAPANVVIIGGGVVGLNAAKIAMGIGADVTVCDVNLQKLRHIDDIFQGKVKTVLSNNYNLEQLLKTADLLIGAVLVAGAKAPHIVSEKLVQQMKPDSVIIDVAVDQGGSIETIDRITTHSDPIYIKHGVIHYAVANIPGSVPRTATLALTNATMPYITTIANEGFIKASRDYEDISKGVNTCQGKLVSKPVAESLNLEFTELSLLVGLN